jgi:hypothetical protein
MRKIRVKAVDSVRVHYVDEQGRPVQGRYAGIDRFTSEPLPDGEEVTDSASYYSRAIRRGELEEVS